MKIKLFIVTYNNSADLNNNLRSLLNSDLLNCNLSITIINNHSNFFLDKDFDFVQVLNNTTRPDFSTGHLSRNWNECIVNGFKDLNDPDCDVLIHCQDDSIFTHDWLTYLLNLHKKYDFVQMGVGDNFCSYLPSAIKNIGLWDERFCGIGYQEADYFLRALIYNKEKTCLNDYQHGRLINNIDYCFCSRAMEPDIFSDHHKKSLEYHNISKLIFDKKWPGLNANYWTDDMMLNLPETSFIDNYIYYPYFEKNIDNLINKRYVL